MIVSRGGVETSRSQSEADVKALVRRIEQAAAPLSEHTLLYLHMGGIEICRDEDVRAAIEHITAGIGGKVMLVDMQGANYALLLEDWPVERGTQVARLLRAAAQGWAFRHLGSAPWINVGVVQISGRVPASEILAKAQRTCDSATRRGHNCIEVCAG